MDCENCSRQLGKLETAISWQGHFVCPECYRRLTGDAALAACPTPPSVAPSLSRPMKSPAAAAILNFLFWGAGYMYAGRSWGWGILVPYILLSVAGCAMMEGMEPHELILYALLSLPLDIVFAWHASAMVKEDQQRRP